MNTVKRRSFVAAALLWAAVLFPLTVSLANAARTTVSTGFDYSSGKYGQSESTDLWYFPFIWKYQSGPWTTKVTVPYLQISGPASVIPELGSIGSGNRPVTATERGLGDIVAAGTYNLFTDGKTGRFLDFTGKVKFGTASANKGLGTGSNDYSGQFDYYQKVGNWIPFGTVGYRFMGSYLGYALNNVFFGNVGAVYSIEKGTSAGALLDYRQKLTDTGSNATDVMVFVSHHFSKEYGIQVYVLHGFTNASPDFELGGLFGVTF